MLATRKNIYPAASMVDLKGKGLSGEAGTSGNRTIGSQTMNINHYTYRVTWSQEDGEHVSLCAEFPSLSWLAPTPEKALAGIRRLVGEVVADMQATGEPIPDPLSEKQYSGRFMVRVPSQVHRALATEAAEQGVSINRLVSAKLAT